MEKNDCPRHQDLIRQLLLGRLDDVDAMEAEALLVECEECGASFEEIFSGPEYDIVDHAVSAAFTSVDLPARHSRHSAGTWSSLAAAAAVAVLIIGGGFLRFHAPAAANRENIQPAQITPKTIVRIDFETQASPVAVHAEKADPPRKTAHKDRARVETKPLFVDDVEDGSLKSWTLHS